MKLLTVEGLTKKFKRRRVLDNIAFSVRQGEVLGLIGPNGSGKTTRNLTGTVNYYQRA